VVDEAIPQVEGELGQKSGESGNKMAFEDIYRFFSGIFSVIIGGDQL